MQDYFLVIVLGYLLGNFQTSFILGKLIKKVDIRTLGRGNAGASNAVESLGWKFGIVVAFLDAFKGLLAILLVRYFFNVTLDTQGAPLLYLAGYSAVLGHIFPFFMNFKGGKGTATLVGMMIGLNPWFGMIGIALIVAITYVTDFVAIGTVGLLVWMIAGTVYFNIGLYPLILTILGMLLSVYLHLPNFQRIKDKNEGRLSLVLKRKKVV
ncbi:MAG: glycerol-3-phosphate acyltransferase 1 [Firmicutes bacterium HGW-Firmicutes-19]|jgi:glycerol-3-phosphate acyltransferase PlsY|nr:MAG: glycerol-3-phosphate acyltransferase 1 [Firmicutes bacterium HGW-Firmicutes-19]